MSANTTCPHCGAKKQSAPTPNHGAVAFKCGSFISGDFYQSDLCRERADHAITRKQLTEMTRITEELAEQLTASMYKLPRVNCDCDQCSVLRRFEAIKKGIQ